MWTVAIIAWLWLILTPFAPASAAGFDGAGKDRITVCVLDTGCSLEGAEGWNFLDGSADITDGVGHGTRVCALLAAYAPDARVVMLKCFDSEQTPDGSAAVRALHAAVDQYGADVIGMSWTASKESAELREAVRHASERGAVMIASAGNLALATGLGRAVYPAEWDELIGVGGVDLDSEGNPAHSLWYLASDAVYVCARADDGGEKGSSFAAARVAGVAAKYLADHPDAGADGVRAMLRDAALDLGAPGYDTQYGWGYIAADP
jgi:subtilisin family serine protease